MKKYNTIRNTKYNLSFLVNNKALLITIGLLSISFIVFLISLSIGSSIIPFSSIIKYLFSPKSSNYYFILHNLRMPRILLSMIIGSMLGISGLILQSTVKNPLATPDIIGITGGAKVAAVLYLTVFSTLSLKWLPLVAILGASISFGIIYLFAWKKGISPIRLVLIGIGIQTGMSAIVTLLIVMSPMYSTSEAYVWLTGSVYGTNWNHIKLILPWAFILTTLVFILSRKLNLQNLGHDISKSMGESVQINRFIFISCSVALAGLSVAFGGGIGFVGLIAPHISRKLVDQTFGNLLPITMIIGALIVLLADLIGRTLFLPLDLPAGVFVAGMGAPFFIYLLYKK